MEEMLKLVASQEATSQPAFFPNPVIVSITNNKPIKKKEGQLDVNGLFKELLRLNSFHVAVE